MKNKKNNFYKFVFLALKLRRTKMLYTYVPHSLYIWIYVCELLHFENHAVLRKETQKKHIRQ